MAVEGLAERDWDLDAGSVPLDFANTAEWHLNSEPDEMLDGFSDLVSWSHSAGLVDDAGAVSLITTATVRPQDAESVFRQALELREAIFHIFQAVAEGERTSETDLTILNSVLQESSSDLRVSQEAQGFEWRWDRESLDSMLGPIARAAAELLTSNELDRVGICAEVDRGCGYLFMDTSRNRSRRWCSMETCGNRSKAKRYYQRRSESAKV